MSTRLTRRSVVLLVALVALQVQSASASVRWCRTDPVVTIDGRVADIFVSAPLSAPLKVNGATEIVVTVPVGVSAELVLAGPGFGRGEEVRFAESGALRNGPGGIEVDITVYVPARDDAMPVRVEFADRLVEFLTPARAEGTANAWVTLRVML
ncbi:MAG: hypothetical protein M3Q03_13435 [Chloroflexota bacterium]|nr:hypothetical protein [Chloroflexota bacterium]